MILPRTFRIASMVAMALPSAALAQDEAHWLVKAGVHDVDPKSNNGHLAGGTLATDVDDSARPTVSLEYLFTPHLGLEALAAWPFRHEVKLNGARAARVKELPPTFSLQYHFNPGGTVSPYLGVGFNYTRFFSIDETGPLRGSRLDLDDSWGVAVHAGIDLHLSGNWLCGFDVRWIDIDTRAKVDGANVGKVAIDPLVYGAYVGYRF
jgi:outer membrane protein